MRFEGHAYRAHDPMWSFTPLSGDGAALRGGRFNPQGTPALYLGLTVITAIKEASQGLSAKINPLVVCSYTLDMEDVVDLREPAGQAEASATPAELACPWMALAAAGETPPSWALANRLIADGVSGIMVPSFAPGATRDDANLVLWRWTRARPHLQRRRPIRPSAEEPVVLDLGGRPCPPADPHAIGPAAERRPLRGPELQSAQHVLFYPGCAWTD